MPENQKKVSFNIQISQNKLKQEIPRSQPKMISHWYYGRIVTTFILIVMAIVAINAMLNTEPESEIIPIATKSGVEKSKSRVEASVDSEQQVNAFNKTAAAKSTKAPKFTEAPKATEAPVIDSPVDRSSTIMTKAVTSSASAKGVLRSQLAMGLWENEPFGEVALPLKVNSNDATGLFYFTELQGLQGQSVYHLWKRQGKIIFQQKKEITTANFKTHTSKLFTMASIGSWTVSITDSDLVPLHAIRFTVVAE